MSAIHGIIKTSPDASVTYTENAGIYRKGKCEVYADAALYKSGDRDAREIILEKWIKYGTGCVKYLYGDFAFVIHDKETGEIYCGRDHFGVRPFFYCFTGNLFIYGSLLKSVVASLPFKPEIRHDYLLNSLVTAKEDKDLTPFENVFRLKPGHYLYYNPNKLEIKPFWSPDAGRPILLRNEAEYTELLREKLVKAVTLRCKGVDNLGSELSGGLDSSAITGMADAYCQHEDRKLKAYSNVFPRGTDIEFKDEREFIGEMTSYGSFNWKGIDRLSLRITDLLQHAVSLQGGYIQQNFSIFSDSLYEEAGNDQIQVLLSGFGGDEMVSGRTSVQWNELIRNRNFSIIHDELFHSGFNFRSLAKAGLLPIRFMRSHFEKPGFTSGVFTKELLDKRFSNLPLQVDFALANDLRQRLAQQFVWEKRDNLTMRQIDRIMHPHLPERLEYCYAAAAFHGIEYRYPLLDVDLVETYLAFPSWIKQHKGVNRYAFRQAIKGYVPEKIRHRNDKSGTTIPQTYYSLVNEGEEILGLIRDASRSSFLNEIFDFSRFPEWYEKLVRRDPDDMNYMMPGAFYTYLMILLYYRDTW